MTSELFEPGWWVFSPGVLFRVINETVVYPACFELEKPVGLLSPSSKKIVRPGEVMMIVESRHSALRNDYYKRPRHRRGIAGSYRSITVALDTGAYNPCAGFLDNPLLYVEIVI